MTKRFDISTYSHKYQRTQRITFSIVRRLIWRILKMKIEKCHSCLKGHQYKLKNQNQNNKDTYKFLSFMEVRPGQNNVEK